MAERKKRAVVPTDKNPHPSKNRRYAKFATASQTVNKRAATSDVISSSANNIFSFQLGTDFLEKPQNLKEKRAVYRYLSSSDEFISRALELKVSIPLSKTRLGIPDGRDVEQCQYILNFFEKMCKKIRLFERLCQMVYEYYLHGVAYPFIEDSEQEAVENSIKELDRELEEALSEQRKELSKDKPLAVDRYDRAKDYAGWERVIILPPDSVEVTTYPFSDKIDVRVIPPGNTKNNQHSVGSSEAADSDIPEPIMESMKDGKIILDTDPHTGSFIHVLKRGGSYYDDIGQSLLDPILGTLVYREKLRQAQTSIASRHMTPIRVVWGENLSQIHVEELRAQVDLALQDPDYSIIANYEINWQEFGSNDRLLDLTSEYEETEKRMMVALGFTSEILRGEGTYAGNRLNLEIINTEFLQLRQIISDFVEEYIFAPVAKRKGFYEIDAFGNKKLLYPKLSFSRLALKDNGEVFGQLLDLYQKGAVPVSYILDLFNIDDKAAFKELKDDLFTPKDSTYNEMLRNLNQQVANKIAESTNITEIFMEHLKVLGLKKQVPEQPAEGGGDMRFASKKDGG
jgi:hypothetical protein